MREVELIEHSPVANVRRPKVSEDSPTIGLDAAELDRLLTAAEAYGPRSAALVSLLVYNGLRIDEALACDVGDFTYQSGSDRSWSNRTGALCRPDSRTVARWCARRCSPRENYIFGPLGLQHTWLLGSAEPGAVAAAAPADVYNDAQNISAARAHDVWADGGIVSTATDMITLL